MPCSRSPERWRAWSAAALLALALGCLRPPGPPPVPAGRDPLTVLRERAALVKTLRAQFDVVVQVAGDERSATGVLLVRPPHEARMRLVAPFGMTVFDALRTNGRTYLTAPFTSGTDAASLEAQRWGPGDSLLFGADAGACRAEGMREDKVLYWCGTPPNRWVSIDPATATAVEEGETDDGEPVVTWTYADYRLIDGVPLPFHITIDYLRPHVAVKIAVDKYEVNPPLRDDQFQPPPGQSSSLEPLHHAESSFCLLSSAFCLLSSPVRASGGGLKPAATADAPTRWVSIDPATATVVEEGETDDGEPVVTWTYADYRLIDGVPLPFHITIDYLRPHVAVKIAVDKYEVNPPLRDDQFQPPPGQSSSLEPLHHAESSFCLLSSAFCLLSSPVRAREALQKPKRTPRITRISLIGSVLIREIRGIRGLSEGRRLALGLAQSFPSGGGLKPAATDGAAARG